MAHPSCHENLTSMCCLQYLYDVAALAAVTACAALGGPALLVAWCCRRSRRRASPAVDGSHARSSKQD